MAEPVPAALLRAVAAHHPPVRPLAAPWRRALGLLPLGVVAVATAPAYWGWRSNFDQLGVGMAFGVSGLQTIAGLAVIGAALREAVPGRCLSARALVLTWGAAAGLEVATTLLTASTAPMVVPPGLWVRWAWECFGMAAIVGAPVLAAVGWMAARAFPARPAVAGALYGLGAGLVADAGARLFCWVSEPTHVLLSHGGAILALSGLGAAMALLVDRAKARGARAALRSERPPLRP